MHGAHLTKMAYVPPHKRAGASVLRATMDSSAAPLDLVGSWKYARRGAVEECTIELRDGALYQGDNGIEVLSADEISIRYSDLRPNGTSTESHWNGVVSADRNEIVFTNRSKVRTWTRV